MNRVFYLFRHGETDWNRERRCQGHTDIPLNETGITQAQELALHLADYPIQLVVSSDLLRAQHTGETVARVKKVPLILDPRLREMNYGVIEGLRYEEAISQHGEEIWEKLKCFKAENDHICFPGGETRKQARARFLSLLEDVIRQHPHEHIAISTHGGVVRAIVHNFLPEDHPMIDIPNCVVYRLIYNEASGFIAEAKPIYPHKS